jgi:hypothetical protein
MKIELLDVEGQIQDIEKTVSATHGLAQGIQTLEIKRKVLENKFPNDVEGALETLSHFAQKLDLKIISLKPSMKKTLLDENNKEVKVENKTCEMIYVNLVMKGSYEDLIKFRELMEEKLSGFIAIDTLSIFTEDPNVSQRLTISLGFNLYLLN